MDIVEEITKSTEENSESVHLTILTLIKFTTVAPLESKEVLGSMDI